MTASNALTPISGTNGYQQHIPVDPAQPLTLSVSNASGKVKIVGSRQSTVWVVVRRTDGHDEEHDLDDEVAMTVAVDGNTISIHPDWNVASGLSGLTRRIKDQLQRGLNPDDWNPARFRFNPDLQYDIRVEIPRDLVAGSTVNAKTASGSVEVSGIRADLTAATASGSAAVADIHGDVSVHTASGSIHVNGVHGSLESNTASGSIHVNGGEVWSALRTVSGSVHLNGVRLKNARIVTVSGSVKGDIVADNAAEYDVKTVSGSVKLDAVLPASRTSRLSFKSVSGSARAGGDWRDAGKKTWTLGSGEDGPTFAVKTVSGSLNLSATADAGVTGRSETMPEQPDDAGSDGDDTERFGPDPGEIGRRVKAELDRNPSVNKTATWARDFAQSFAPPTPPTPPTPSTPATPATPAAPAPPPQPPAGNGGPWSWSSGPGAPGANATGNTDTEPLPMPQPAPASSREAEQADAVTEREAAVAEQEAANDGASDDAGSLEAMESGRLQILEALERGEIDIDDALAEIEREEARGT